MTISNKSHPWATKAEEPTKTKPAAPPRLVVLTYYVEGVQKKIALVMDHYMNWPGKYENVLGWLGNETGKRMATIDLTCAIEGVSYDVFDDDTLDGVLQLAGAYGLPALQLTIASTGKDYGWGANGEWSWTPPN